MMGLLDLRKKTGQRLHIFESGTGLGDFPVDLRARSQTEGCRDRLRRRGANGFFRCRDSFLF